MKYLLLILFLFSSITFGQGSSHVTGGLFNQDREVKGEMNVERGIFLGDEKLGTYNESSTSFDGSWSSPPGGDETDVTFDPFLYTIVGNMVTFSGVVTIGPGTTTGVITQTPAGKLPSPSQDRWIFIVVNSNGFRLRVGANGSLLIYKVLATNIISNTAWGPTEAIQFTGSYIL